MDNKETRSFEFRVERQGEDESPVITGHAAVFNEEAVIGGMFREKIETGAFTESIKSDDVRALFNHSPDFVLGRNKAGTLELSEDEKGLAIRITPPDTQFANDLVKSIDRGDISQMSFGFRIEEEEWTEDSSDGKLDLRTLKKVRLFDVSPVTYPAYEGTDVAVRSHDEWKNKQVKKSNINVLRKKLTLAERT